MKYQVCVTFAVVLALLLPCAHALAEKGADQKANKKTAVGTVTKVNVKAKTVTVDPAGASQQIQTQQQAPAKQGKPKKVRPLVFVVDENTVVKEAEDAKQPKGQSAKEDLNAKMNMLKTGQLVRVVYTQDKGPGKEGPKPKKGTEEQAQDEPQEQAQEGAQEQAQEKESKKQKAERPKVVLRALSIEILPSQDQQQQQQQQPVKEKDEGK